MLPERDEIAIRGMVQQALARILGARPETATPPAPSKPAAGSAPAKPVPAPAKSAPEPAKPAPKPSKPVASAPGSSASSIRSPRPLLTEEAVRTLPPGTRYQVPEGAMVTPSAREVALLKQIRLVQSPGGPKPSPAVAGTVGTPAVASGASSRSIALGADHGGFEMKQDLKGYLGELGYTAVDCGPETPDPVDYPDFAYAVAALVSEGRCAFGIFVDGAGIGSCMVANKVPGVLAAHCYDISTASNAREHNNANFLTLGGRLTGPGLARQIVKVFLETPFGGGRHAPRVDKILGVERRFLRRSDQGR